MTRYEQEFMAIVPNALRDIAKELKRMNKLRALELKAKMSDTTGRRGDDIMKGEDE